MANGNESGKALTSLKVTENSEFKINGNNKIKIINGKSLVIVNESSKRANNFKFIKLIIINALKLTM